MAYEVWCALTGGRWTWTEQSLRPHLESVHTYNPDGVFLAILRFHKSDGVWKPHKVFRLTEPSPLAPAAG